MSFLKRILSIIWSEPRPSKTLPSKDTTRTSDVTEPSGQAPLRINSELFELILEPEWEHLSWLDNDGQFSFENKETGMSLVLSTLKANLPDEKIEEMANVLLNSQIEGVDITYREKGLYPVGAMEDVTQRSWGFQASLSRIYPNGGLHRYFGLVSPILTMNVTIVGDNTPLEIFETNVEKIMYGIRFSDEFWGEKPIPENTLLS